MTSEKQIVNVAEAPPTELDRLRAAAAQHEHLVGRLAALTDEWLCRSVDLDTPSDVARAYGLATAEVREMLPEDTHYWAGP